jgi:hypothetical protein
MGVDFKFVKPPPPPSDEPREWFDGGDDDGWLRADLHPALRAVRMALDAGEIAPRDVIASAMGQAHAGEYTFGDHARRGRWRRYHNKSG